MGLSCCCANLCVKSGNYIKIGPSRREQLQQKLLAQRAEKKNKKGDLKKIERQVRHLCTKYAQWRRKGLKNWKNKTNKQLYDKIVNDWVYNNEKELRHKIAKEFFP